MSEEDNDKYEEVTRNPYRDDPVWEDWNSRAYGVQGGADDSSSSESEDETADVLPVSLPSSCVCKQCRLVFTVIRDRCIIVESCKIRFKLDEENKGGQKW
jgi:hypothetical protein